MTFIGLLMLIGAGYWCWSLFHQHHYRGKAWWQHGWPALVILIIGLGLLGSTSPSETKSTTPAVKTKRVVKTKTLTATNDAKLTALQAANASSASSLKKATHTLAKRQTKVDQLKGKNRQNGATTATVATHVSTGENPSNATLADKTYTGQQTIIINHNQPAFSASDLTTTNGAWQKYGQLDTLNRVSAANALLNQSLMPKTKREALTVSPTGWHNKRIASGWLYNRSHLIGYQLTGQNNNWKNLMTGTRTLNDPEMTTYENQVAAYLKASPKHYVRYEVNPVFKGNDLLARGVQMRAQSIGADTVSFNVYIFNVQPGVTLNYATGTSRITK